MRRVAYLLDHAGGLAEEVEGVPRQVPQAHALGTPRDTAHKHEEIVLAHMAGPRVSGASPSTFSESMGPEGCEGDCVRGGAGLYLDVEEGDGLGGLARVQVRVEVLGAPDVVPHQHVHRAPRRT